MDTKEIIKKVRQIELKSKRKANQLFLGEYHSSFKGRGMIFSEIRPYQFGDDVRNIDWNKTARFNEPFVKVFEEERELTMMLAVDISSSMAFGTRKQQKRETIAEICATLAFSAIAYNDKVGLILFAQEVELYIPAKKGKKHVLRIIRELVDFEPKTTQTNINNCLHFILNSFKRKTNVMLLSDFNTEDSYEKNLRIIAKKHDITGIRIYDNKEESIPNIGWVNTQDLETGKQQLVNTSSENVRKYYERYHLKIAENFNQSFAKSGCSMLSLTTDEDYYIPLINLFKNHTK